LVQEPPVKTSLILGVCPAVASAGHFRRVAAGLFRSACLTVLLAGPAQSATVAASEAVPLRQDTAGQQGLPELVSVKRIWNEAPHNAFTDLLWLGDRWFCAFRESDAHVGGDGRIRILVSTDGDQWKPAALVAEEGIDLRDPKLSITPDGRLMLVAGGSVYRGTRTLKGRQPRVAFSGDGSHWTPPARVLGEGDWLWRVTWHKGRAYGVSYNTAAKSDDGTPRGDWSVTLVSSGDGLRFERVARLDVPGHPNETTLRFLDGDVMMALVRREAGNQRGWIGTSRPPYRQWEWHETEYRLGGPNFIQVPDGSLWASTRFYGGPIGGQQRQGTLTVLARMDRTSLSPILALPSGGDTSYAGMAWHDGLLWMSYYSSHEGKSGIYLAKIRLPAAER
jgi:hypothetical protein